MGLAWSSQYETGDVTIDNHHQELFHLVSRLDSAIFKPDEIHPIVEFLEWYVVAHFQEEETLMRKSDYTGYGHHKHEHEQFKKMVSVLREKITKREHATKIVYSIRRLIDQLVDHIITVDIGIASLVSKDHHASQKSS